MGCDGVGITRYTLNFSFANLVWHFFRTVRWITELLLMLTAERCHLICPSQTPTSPTTDAMLSEVLPSLQDLADGHTNMKGSQQTVISIITELVSVPSPVCLKFRIRGVFEHRDLPLASGP